MTAIIITTINKMGLGQQSHFVSNVSLVPFKLLTPVGGGDNVLGISKNLAISWS